ncbi:MAG: hypothetical protein KAG96_04330 [Ichthyobacteriaceae bacterium]|nr:hypothetical protein [Ichthyobacteriaceae bacterium]
MKKRYYKAINQFKIHTSGRDFKVFLVFFAVSFFFWGLIKMSKLYTQTLSYVVSYINAPVELMVDELPDVKLELVTTASGFRFVSYIIGNKNIELSFSKLRKFNDGSYYLLPQDQITFIKNQFSSDVNLSHSSLDTLFFDFSKKVSKKIPVELNCDIKLSPSYKYKNKLKLLPDSVVITGRKLDVEKVISIKTDSLIIDDVFNSDEFIVTLVNPAEDLLVLSGKNISVDVQVERYTQSGVDVQIELKNVPKGYLLRVFPAKAKVVFNTGLTHYNDITQHSFKVVADYNLIKNTESNFIKLDVGVISDEAEFIRVEPSDVEFLLRKIDNAVN